MKQIHSNSNLSQKQENDLADPDSPTSTQPLEEAERIAKESTVEGAEAVVEQASMLADIFGSFFTRLQQPWTLYQMGIILFR